MQVHLKAFTKLLPKDLSPQLPSLYPNLLWLFHRGFSPFLSTLAQFISTLEKPAMRCSLVVTCRLGTTSNWIYAQNARQHYRRELMKLLGDGSKPCTPVVHIKKAGIYGCSSPINGIHSYWSMAIQISGRQVNTFYTWLTKQSAGTLCQHVSAGCPQCPKSATPA